MAAKLQNFPDISRYLTIKDDIVGLKYKLAALDRKIQLELAKENQPKEGELQEQVVNSDVATDVTYRQDSKRKGLRP